MKLNRVALGIFFVIAGYAHFVIPGSYVRIVPPMLPYPLALVYISGFAEVYLGVLCFFTRHLKIARWGLIALLVAIFPANIYMAYQLDLFPNIPPLLFYLRLPLQALLIYWVWVATRVREGRG